MELEEILNEIDLVMKRLEETKQWDLSMKLSRVYESMKNWQMVKASDE